jgi:hypothetical protein
VRVVERIGQLDAHDQHLAHGQPLVGLHHVAEDVALQELHGHVGPALDFTDVVHRDDVGVRQAAGGARLAQEACAAVAVLAQRGVQELEGDVAADAGIVRLVDAGHAAAPERAEDLVAPDLALRRIARRPAAGKRVARAGARVAAGGRRRLRGGLRQLAVGRGDRGHLAER